MADFSASSKAVFAQANYHVTDAFRVTAGVRYTWDTRFINRHGIQAINGVDENIITPVAALGFPITVKKAGTCAVGVNAGIVAGSNCVDPHTANYSYPAWTFGVDYQIAIPKRGSFILTHDWDGKIRGLKEWPVEKRPPVATVFWSFRIMVGLGFAMLGLGLWSLWLRYRGRLYAAPLMHRAAILMGPSGFVAVLAGWITTEAGRQPFTVYGLLTTAQSASPIDAAAVASSLIAFILVYFTLFGAGVFYILRLMNKPPHPDEEGLPRQEPIRAGGILPASALVAPATAIEPR